MSHPFEDPNVARVFAAFPSEARVGLQYLRKLIFDVAARTEGVGCLEETLKWGQPAYLTPETKTGTTIRLGCPKTGGFAIYVHCQTSIVSDFRALFPDDFHYEGNRAIYFTTAEALPAEKLELFITRALTYHRR
ncbi:MAG: DUF1801 domain-containing protein [Pseudomonadota bacterium]